MARAARTAGGLTEKQERFALAYFRTANASAAYREAYEPRRMSDKQVNTEASKLLKNPGIARRVAVLRERAALRTDLSVDKVRNELARLCFARPSDYVNADGTLKQIRELSEDALAAIASIEVAEEYEGTGKNRKLVGFTKKLKLWDKNPALDKAMRHLGLFEKDNKQQSENFWTEILNLVADKSRGLPAEASARARGLKVPS